VVRVQFYALDAKQVEAYFEQECQMQAQDKLQEETSERKNALEGYILGLRNKWVRGLWHSCLCSCVCVYECAHAARSCMHGGLMPGCRNTLACTILQVLEEGG